MSNQDFYKILQVTPDASSEVINVAFRALAEKYYPSSPEGNTEKYNEVVKAYEILGNPSRRREYDIQRQVELDAAPSFTESSLPAQNINTGSTSGKVTLQSVINLIYEQINFESVNHNPAKARTYQEIYDDIIKNKNKIENSPPDNNVIWQILKAYQQYLNNEEFENLKLMISRMFEVSGYEADRILKKTDITNLPFKKTYLFIAIVIVLGLLALIGWLISAGSRDKKVFNEIINAPVNVMNDETALAPETYTAVVVDPGFPVNIRTAPTTEWDNIADKIQPDTQVEVINVQQNGWYYIKNDDIEGYVYGGLLKDNTLPDSYPVAEVSMPLIKAYDRSHNMLRALDEGDRFVVFYQDHDNYYLKTENDRFIGIKKDAVTLENPENTNIRYIPDLVKPEIKYFAATQEEQVIEPEQAPGPEDETETEPTELPVETEELPEPTPEPLPPPKEETYVPPIIFPGKAPAGESNLNNYINTIKNNVINNWDAPAGAQSYDSVVIFRINRNGELVNVTLSQSSGNKAVDEASIRAVKLASPFSPLPSAYDNDYMDIQMNFDAN